MYAIEVLDFSIRHRSVWRAPSKYEAHAFENLKLRTNMSWALWAVQVLKTQSTKKKQLREQH